MVFITAKGNGALETCVQNLFRIIRGEVPYERLKGVDATLMDRPSKEAGPRLLTDLEWLVTTYEPRADLQNMDLHSLAARLGDFGIQIGLERRKGG